MRMTSLAAAYGSLTLLGLATLQLLPPAAAAAPTPRVPDPVWAATGNADNGKILYLMHCKACHGGHGWGDGPRAIPALAGQREKYLVEQLALFATGTRAGQSMHETMQRPDLGWIQPVRDLAAFLSAAPRSPHPEYGESQEVAAGARIYQSACKECHGSRGEGSAPGIPAIGGQHSRYLAAQLTNFVQGHRDAENRQALVAMESLSEQDIQDVASYASRLSALTASDPRP
jgi:cytochrome c553